MVWIKQKITEAIVGDMGSMQVSAYACPPTEYIPNIPNIIPNTDYYKQFNQNKTMSIKEYKQKFIEIYKQMEEEYGMAQSVYLSHDIDDEDSEIRCIVDF